MLLALLLSILGLCAVFDFNRGFPHPWTLLSAQLGGHLYCGNVFIPCTDSSHLHSIYVERLLLFRNKNKKRKIKQNTESFPSCHFPLLLDGGFSAWVAPCLRLWFRSTMKPTHIWMGKAILILSLTSFIITCSNIQQMTTQCLISFNRKTAKITHNHQHLQKQRSEAVALKSSIPKTFH